MSLNIEKMLADNAFENMSDEKKSLIKNILLKVQGKNAGEAFPIIVISVKELVKGKEISKEEKKAMFTVLKENMSDNEIEKYNTLLNFFEPKE